jgi:CheY-like chemotaxis protein
MLQKQQPGASLVSAEKLVVLIVEEDALLRLQTAERLRAAGFEVIEAADSAEAEQILKSTVVVVCPLGLPPEAVPVRELDSGRSGQPVG